MRVLARAYRDRPLDRILVGENKRVFYIAHPSSVDSAGDCETGGVGFPRGAVFQFDPSLYDLLEKAWQAEDRPRLLDLWASATPVGKDDRSA